MSVNVDEGNIKQGLLGLVVALVEIIQEVLERQAVRRMEGGRLSDQEIERLGLALVDLKEALENIKRDNDLNATVESVREDLDKVTDDMICNLIGCSSVSHGLEKT
jgi:replicative DNA helicase